MNLYISQYYQRALCLLALTLGHVSAHAKHITTFIPRSQGANTARELVGWQRELYRPLCVNYTALATTIEFTRSFDTCHIANELFSTNRLTFAGSQYPDRKKTDIIADYFGLPTNFHGTLAIKPRIENVILDFNYYFGLNDWFPGLYARVHMPVAHTRWSLGLDDCIACGDKYRGCTVFPGCYMYSGQPTSNPSSQAVCTEAAAPITCPPTAGPPSCPTVALPQRCIPCCPVNSTLNPQNPQLNPQVQFRNANCTTQSLREALSGNFTFGDMVEPWRYGRFDFCPRSKTTLADIDVIVGLNLAEGDFGHFGLFGMGVFPTGNRPTGKWIFEPIVGNGRHWELGGGLTCHLSAFDLCSPHNIGFYIEGNVTYVCKTHQVRSFDFKNNGLLSRYMLLKEYDTMGNYAQTMINAINFNTRNCEVRVGFKADVSGKLFIAAGGWEVDLGYNFYYREREKICIKTTCPCAIDSRRFGIKGVEGVCCEQYAITNNTIVGGKVFSMSPLNATQNNATMFIAQIDSSSPVTTSECDDNTCVCLAWNSTPIQAGDSVPVSNLTPTNMPPYYGPATTPATIISCADLDPHSAEQCRMLTHKVFFHIGRMFEKSYYCPHVGIGGEIEFNGRKSSGLSQWGVWVKGGLMF